MEYQTFRGTDVKEALSAVKAALGPDAMIGSTRFVSGDRRGGLNQSYVEVLAAQPDSDTRKSPFALGAHLEIPSNRPSSRRRSSANRSRQDQWRSHRRCC